jgi:hypothetical protein
LIAGSPKIAGFDQRREIGRVVCVEMTETNKIKGFKCRACLAKSQESAATRINQYARFPINPHDIA